METETKVFVIKVALSLSGSLSLSLCVFLTLLTLLEAMEEVKTLTNIDGENERTDFLVRQPGCHVYVLSVHVRGRLDHVVFEDWDGAVTG